MREAAPTHPREVQSLHRFLKVACSLLRRILRDEFPLFDGLQSAIEHPRVFEIPS
jgi:hypothetical protein